jgi:hypothetical protein
MRILSIAWFAQQRRGETLARRLGAEFVKLPCPRTALLSRLGHYRRLSRETTAILEQRRPEVTIVQNPPIHAVAAVAAYARRTGTSFIVDSHSGPFLDAGLLATWHRRRFARLGRQALVTLIHNRGLIPYADRLGLQYLVLDDPVPEDPTTEAAQLQHPAVAVVCGYGRDEPLPELLRAIRLVPEAHFYLTGRAPPGLRQPENATATGFLAELDYWRLLNGSDCVVTLTTREATILGGGYDGLSAGKALVLSATQTLAGLFPKGAVLVENRAESIAEGVRSALRRAEGLALKGRALREEKAREWERQFRALTDVIAQGELAHPGDTPNGTPLTGETMSDER